MAISRLVEDTDLLPNDNLDVNKESASIANNVKYEPLAFLLTLEKRSIGLIKYIEKVNTLLVLNYSPCKKVHKVKLKPHDVVFLVIKIWRYIYFYI